MKKNIKSIFLGVFSIISLLGIGAYTYAQVSWTPPTQNPPSANISGPLNSGSTGQVKSGTLTTGGIFNDGSAIVQNGTYVGIPDSGETISPGITVKTMRGSSTRNLCANASGKIVVCANQVPPPPIGVPTVDVKINNYSDGPIILSAPGAATTVSWTTTNAVACFSDWTSSNATSGSETRNPTTSTTYTVRCMNSLGQVATDSAQVLMPSSGVNLTWNQNGVTSFFTFGTLSWSGSNIVSCAQTSTNQSGIEYGSWSDASTTVFGSENVAIIGNTTFTISCQTLASTTVSDSVTINSPTGPYRTELVLGPYSHPWLNTNGYQNRADKNGLKIFSQIGTVTIYYSVNGGSYVPITSSFANALETTDPLTTLNSTNTVNIKVAKTNPFTGTEISKVYPHTFNVNRTVIPAGPYPYNCSSQNCVDLSASASPQI